MSLSTPIETLFLLRPSPRPEFQQDSILPRQLVHPEPPADGAVSTQGAKAMTRTLELSGTWRPFNPARPNPLESDQPPPPPPDALATT